MRKRLQLIMNELNLTPIILNNLQYLKLHLIQIQLFLWFHVQQVQKILHQQLINDDYFHVYLIMISLMVIHH